MRLATPSDTKAIYSLLEACKFPYLDEHSYDDAKKIIERSHILLTERNGKVAMMVSIHLHSGEKLGLDVAVAPDYRGKIISRSLSKQVLTYCFGLGDCIVVESNNPTVIKLALLLGFKMTDAEDSDRTTLELTKEAFYGKLV